MNHKTLVSAFLFFTLCSLFGSDSPNRTLAELAQGTTKAKIVLDSSEIDQSMTLSGFIEHDDKRVRSKFFRAVWSDLYREEDINQQVELTEILVQGIDDDYIGSWILNRLKLPPFEKEYFSDASREMIKEYDTSRGQMHNYLRVLGVAEVEVDSLDLKGMSQREKLFEDERANTFFENTNTEHFIYYSSDIWVSLLVLARSGDPEAINEVVAEVETTDRSTLVGRSELIKDLGYIRQGEAVNLLVELLFSEIPPPDQRVSGDVIIPPLSEWAVQGLSLCLDGFPIGYWDVITDENVEIAREYIRNYEGAWRIIGKWQPEEVVEPAPVVEVIETQVIEEVAVEEPAEAIAVEPTQEPVEQPSNWWLWLIGLLVVVGGVLVVRRKS